MAFNIESSWADQLAEEISKPYFKELQSFITSEYDNAQIYPPKDLLFNAFEKCPFNTVKVVILGQDPYHEPGQAHGLCFSVPDGIPFPPSLRNIFKELSNDLAIAMPHSGNLERWAIQGVFLLNATLTVRAHQAGSHQKKGWEQFTDHVIQKLSESNSNLVFILWGSYAQRKEILIDNAKHLIIKSVHPSPLSAHRGFFGNHHFSKTNEYLIAHKKEVIKW
jgi:uracil-DNA glycosylase